MIKHIFCCCSYCVYVWFYICLISISLSLIVNESSLVDLTWWFFFSPRMSETWWLQLKRVVGFLEPKVSLMLLTCHFADSGRGTPPMCSTVSMLWWCQGSEVHMLRVLPGWFKRTITENTGDFDQPQVCKYILNPQSLSVFEMYSNISFSTIVSSWPIESSKARRWKKDLWLENAKDSLLKGEWLLYLPFLFFYFFFLFCF